MLSPTKPWVRHIGFTRSWARGCESVYEAALAYELEKRGLRVTRQQAIPLLYEEVRIHAGFYADLVVEDEVIVEIKALEIIAPVHKNIF